MAVIKRAILNLCKRRRGNLILAVFSMFGISDGSDRVLSLREHDAARPASERRHAISVVLESHNHK
jgi:hypothetical protein